MSTSQCVEPRQCVRGRRSPRSWRRTGSGGWSLLGFWGVLGLLSLAPAGGLSAQTRGDLRISAQVVSSGPSQAALAAALNPPGAGAEPGLADITRELRTPVADSAGVALRPRPVVTIEFLRN